MNAPESRRYYDANLTIHSPGEWTVVVEVSTEALGQATFTVPLRVGEAPLSPRIAGTVVWAVVVAILAAGAALRVVQRRPSPARSVPSRVEYLRGLVGDLVAYQAAVVVEGHGHGLAQEHVLLQVRRCEVRGT